MEYLRAFYVAYGVTRVLRYNGSIDGDIINTSSIKSFDVLHNREKPHYEPIEVELTPIKKLQGIHNKFYKVMED